MRPEFSESMARVFLVLYLGLYMEAREGRNRVNWRKVDPCVSEPSGACGIEKIFISGRSEYMRSIDEEAIPREIGNVHFQKILFLSNLGAERRRCFVKYKFNWPC